VVIEIPFFLLIDRFPDLKSNRQSFAHFQKSFEKIWEGCIATGRRR
jgi:hypothetical protein